MGPPETVDGNHSANQVCLTHGGLASLKAINVELLLSRFTAKGTKTGLSCKGLRNRDLMRVTGLDRQGPNDLHVTLEQHDSLSTVQASCPPICEKRGRKNWRPRSPGDKRFRSVQATNA